VVQADSTITKVPNSRQHSYVDYAIHAASLLGHTFACLLLHSLWLRNSLSAITYEEDMASSAPDVLSGKYIAILILENPNPNTVFPLLWLSSGYSRGVEGFARCQACPCRRMPTPYPLSRQRAVDRAFHAFFAHLPRGILLVLQANTRKHLPAVSIAETQITPEPRSWLSVTVPVSFRTIRA
jgi:hypothetical protein